MGTKWIDYNKTPSIRVLGVEESEENWNILAELMAKIFQIWQKTLTCRIKEINESKIEYSQTNLHDMIVEILKTKVKILKAARQNHNLPIGEII